MSIYYKKNSRKLQLFHYNQKKRNTEFNIESPLKQKKKPTFT